MTELERLLKKVIDNQYFAVLSSLDVDLPYSNLVSFYITDDFKSLVFITGRNTRKYRNIIKSPGVSLLIDNRTNQPSDISQAVAITVIGTAREASHPAGELKNRFLIRHPQLKQFVADPQNAYIIVTIEEYIIAGFEKTQRLVLSR